MPDHNRLDLQRGRYKTYISRLSQDNMQVHLASPFSSVSRRQFIPARPVFPASLSTRDALKGILIISFLEQEHISEPDGSVCSGTGSGKMVSHDSMVSMQAGREASEMVVLTDCCLESVMGSISKLGIEDLRCGWARWAVADCPMNERDLPGRTDMQAA
jgi:hypothetical protein